VSSCGNGCAHEGTRGTEEEDDASIGVVTYTALVQGIANVTTALKVPGLCPFFFLIMVVWKQVRELGCEESKVMGSGLLVSVCNTGNGVSCYCIGAELCHFGRAAEKKNV
jgi:hypothetical protein